MTEDSKRLEAKVIKLMNSKDKYRIDKFWSEELLENVLQ